jgi:hypothetical protein
LEPLGKFRFQQGALLTQMKELGIDLKQQAQAEILIQEAMKTSEIEGERLDLRAVSHRWPDDWAFQQPALFQQEIKKLKGFGYALGFRPTRRFAYLGKNFISTGFLSDLKNPLVSDDHFNIAPWPQFQRIYD